MPLTLNPVVEINPNGALIGYNNLLTASTTSDAEKALVPNTWERWRPSSGAITVKFQMAAAAEVDYIAIAAHALSGETFLLQTAPTVGGAVTDVDSFSPLTNAAILSRFETRTIQEVIFTGTLIAANEIGAIFAGKLLQMERSIYGGHSPMSLSQKNTFQSSKSDSGQFLGRNVTRKGAKGSFSWKNIDPDWYRDFFQPFVEVATIKPFFIVWQALGAYSSEVSFVQTDGDIMPSNMGSGHSMMQVSMTVTGHEDL